MGLFRDWTDHLRHQPAAGDDNNNDSAAFLTADYPAELSALQRLWLENFRYINCTASAEKQCNNRTQTIRYQFERMIAHAEYEYKYATYVLFDSYMNKHNSTEVKATALRQFVERIQRHDDRQTADELRNQTELEQIFRHELLQQLADANVALAFGRRAEAHAVRGDATEGR